MRLELRQLQLPPEPPPAFGSVAEARLAFVQARHELERLDRELSGCDWCCGGGDERRIRAQAQRDAADLFLLDHDVVLPTRCQDCRYYDGTVHHQRLGLSFGRYCPRCAERRGITESP